MYPALVHELAEILGEAEKRPLTQIAAVIGVLGEQAVLELLAETQRLEEAGGMLVSAGGRRRSRGGVFFTLARKRLGKKDRVAVFGWQKPREGDHMPHLAQLPSTDSDISPNSSDGGENGSGGNNGGNDTNLSPAETAELQALSDEQLPVVEVVPPNQEQPPTNPSPAPTTLVDPMTDTTDLKNREEAETPAPTTLPAPSVPVPRDEMARAVARTTARRAVARAIANLELIDQRLVLLDTLAELEQGQVGAGPQEAPRDVSAERVPDGGDQAAPPSQPASPVDVGEDTLPSAADVSSPTPKASNGNGNGRGLRRAALLGAIRETPGIGLGELALRIYDEDTPTNRKRAQSIISVLKRSGEVHSAGRGRFEVV
jgi:Phosphorylated adapter RNA export protein, RNA-binding domain